MYHAWRGWNFDGWKTSWHQRQRRSPIRALSHQVPAGFRNCCRVRTASPPMKVACVYLAKSARADGAVPKVPRTVRYLTMISSIGRNVHVPCTGHNCLWRRPRRLCQIPFGQVPCLTDCCHDHRYQSTGFGGGRSKSALDTNPVHKTGGIAVISNGDDTGGRNQLLKSGWSWFGPA
jgi:hypothetical protein